MHLTDADIAHLASLSRLELTPPQRTLFSEQLSRVLDYLDQINQGDAQQEAATRARQNISPSDVRADVVVPSAPGLIEQAPVQEGSSVVSPPLA